MLVCCLVGRVEAVAVVAEVVAVAVVVAEAVVVEVAAAVVVEVAVAVSLIRPSLRHCLPPASACRSSASPAGGNAARTSWPFKT